MGFLQNRHSASKNPDENQKRTLEQAKANYVRSTKMSDV